MKISTPSSLLLTIAEPTRLRILNCLAAAPLFVSDLQQVLEIPQPTVSRHLGVLRTAGIVRDTPIAQFVLYRLRRRDDASGRMLNTILESLADDETYRQERHRARSLSRSNVRQRTDR
ncbi:MAG: ArsR/SmtB family transcription factor [Gemmatimonadales bacterium]